VGGRAFGCRAVVFFGCGGTANAEDVQLRIILRDGERLVDIIGLPHLGAMRIQGAGSPVVERAHEEKYLERRLWLNEETS
jgi:hypothetical protein